MRTLPFARYVAALIVGILLYRFAPDSSGWPLAGLGLIGLLGLVIGLVVDRNRERKPVRVGAGLGALLLLASVGWAVAWLRTPANRPDNLIHLTQPLDGYEGVVASLPEERAKTYRVELELRRGRVGGRWQALSGRVIVYLDKTDTSFPVYGEVWLVAGQPRVIDPPLNPGEFDYKQFLAYKGIYHQQYLKPVMRQIQGYDPPSHLTAVAYTVNRRAAETFTRRLGSKPEYAVVNAMILGVRDDLDPALYQAYSAAGAIHILSVSGLHVGVVFTVLAGLLKSLKRTRRGRISYAVIQLSLLWFYALMTGLSAPVLRSAGMFSLLIIGDTAERSQHGLNTLAASAFFILCFDPFALFAPGFQLSYLAVGGIIAWQPFLSQLFTFRYWWANRLWEITSLALIAQLVTFPLGVYYFHQFPTYFLLANPVVMGLSTVLIQLAMATLAVSPIPLLSDAIGGLLWLVAWLLNQTVLLTERLPAAVWSGLTLSPGRLLLVYSIIGAGVALLISRQKRYVWAVLAGSFALAMLSIQSAYNRQHQQLLTVHFLPHRTAVSLTDGPRATLLTDRDLTADPRSYDFYLKNTFIDRHITDLTTLALDADTTKLVGLHRQREFALWVWQGKKILIVNKLTGRSRWRLPAVVDYLIIRRNALRDWSQLDGRVAARHILFDDSSRTPLTDQLLADAQKRGIRCHSVRQMGAFVASLH
jgi:competence protein ComEC